MVLTIFGVIGGLVAATWAYKRASSRGISGAWVLTLLAFIVGFWVIGGVAAGITNS